MCVSVVMYVYACVVSDICSWEMTVIGCGVCGERCVYQDVNVCVVSICVGVYVLNCGCLCSYMSCYVYVCRCLCINRPRLGVC